MDIPVKLAKSILSEMTEKQAAVFDMLDRSFLSDEGKAAYRQSFTERQKRLKRDSEGRGFGPPRLPT